MTPQQSPQISKGKNLETKPTSSDPNVIPLNIPQKDGVEKQPKAESSIHTKKGPAGRKKVGGLSSIDDLLANVEKEEQHKKDNRLDWTVDNVSKIWQDYMGTLEMQSTIIALGSTKLSLEGETKLCIVTPNKLNTETIKKEMNLIERIRNSYPDREIEISIVDDLSQFPELRKVEKVQKDKTNEEKLDILIGKNPKISEFIKRFDLKVDK